MDLYTVTLRRKQVISTYDAKGRLSGMKEMFLDQVHAGCPAQLANTYRTKFPESFVSAVREIPEPQRRDGGKARVTDGASVRQRRPQAASGRVEAPMHVDDMAEAVSRAVAREAA